MRNKLISLLLTLILAATIFPISTFAAKPATIETETLDRAILATFEWAKQGHDILLNENFLQGVGMTDGDWFPINMGIYGYEPSTHGKYLAAIEADITQKYAKPSKLDRNKATEWHRIALAVIAMGGDPTNIGKDADGNPIDLIADGTYDCVLSAVDRQGINGPIWALIALDSKNYPVPADAIYQREDFIALIAARQMSDGGFALGGSATNDLPSDPDLTAMALQALAPYQSSATLYTAHGGVQKTVAQITEQALAQMSNLQQPDGDFESWGAENVESTAQMLVALTALGIDPYQDARFIKDGNTLIDGILKYQTKDGGFAHSFVSDPHNPTAVPGESNRMASEQALLGLIAYQRFANGEGGLYDFPKIEGTDDPDENSSDGVFKPLPWLVLKETRLSGNGNELFVAILQEDTSNYTIQIPYGFPSVAVAKTPFAAQTTTNLTTNSIVNYGTDNSFYYLDEDGKRVNFNITLAYHYYAEPESILRELEYLVALPVTTENQKEIETATSSISNRYDALEFAYEKCYIDAKIKVSDALATIQKNIDNAETDKPLPDEGDDDDKDESKDKLKTLLSQEKVIAQRFNALPSISKVEASDAPAIRSVKAKANALITAFKAIFDDLSAADQLLAQGAISELEKIVALSENLLLVIDQAKENPAEDENKKPDNVTTHTITTTKTIVTTKSFNDIIPKLAFDEIMGIDENVKGIGKIDDGKETCTFIFNGADIQNPMNFLCGINTTSENERFIHALSPEASIISLEHQGELPGTALLQFESDLTDGDYILFSYDEAKMQAVVIEKITIEDGFTQFLVSENQDYFIAKKAFSHSLLTTSDQTNGNEPHNTENVAPNTNASTNTSIDQKAPALNLIVGISFLVLAVLLAVALLIMLLRRNQDAETGSEESDVTTI